MDWFGAPGNQPFVVALLVMFGLTAVEVIALLVGFSLNDMVDEFVVPHAEMDAPDLDAPDVDAPGHASHGLDSVAVEGPGLFSRFLAWLYIGKVPVLMVLIILLTVFGLCGLIGQGILRSLTGLHAPAILAAPLVLIASLPIVRACTAGLHRILPQDESSAVDPSTFVGRTATITNGTARTGLPADARLRDQFGTEHHVLVEPEEAGQTFAAGTLVLLVRQVGAGRFSAISNPNDALIEKE
jgi:hypothetical protein